MPFQLFPCPYRNVSLANPSTPSHPHRLTPSHRYPSTSPRLEQPRPLRRGRKRNHTNATTPGVIGRSHSPPTCDPTCNRSTSRIVRVSVTFPAVVNVSTPLNTSTCTNGFTQERDPSSVRTQTVGRPSPQLGTSRTTSERTLESVRIPASLTAVPSVLPRCQA